MIRIQTQYMILQYNIHMETTNWHTKLIIVFQPITQL